jgi:hypothetical protein
MAAAWNKLDTALKAARQAGRPARLWWRDDDAEMVSPALETLAARAERHRIPLSLAVIPAGASKDLRELFARGGDWAALVHGFAHKNYAPPGEKRAEFGHHRAVSRMRDELCMGLDRLGALLPGHARAVLVPPWNRIAPELLPVLPEIGFEALSTFGDVPRRPAIPTLNCHLDIINWRSRRFAGAASLIDKLVSLLELQRQTGAPDPIGLLTHHRQHDRAAELFLDKLAARLATQGVRWLSLEEALTPSRSPAQFEARGSTHGRLRASATA